MAMDQLANYTVLPPSWRRLGEHRLIHSIDWPGVLAFLLPFLLYLLTQAPTIYNLDSAELTTAAATGGIVRATGYPLYLVLGHMWSLLPLGDVGFRLNLFSAFCAATTILLLELSLRRLRAGRWARLGALGLLASAPYFWAMSLIAEVYTLHTALMAGIILAALRWREQPSPRRLALIAFLVVLSLGNHAATVLLVPGLVWLVLTTAPQQLRQPRTWRLSAASGFLAATVFLYIPLRYAFEPAFNYAGAYDTQGHFVPVNLHTVEGLLWLVSGRAFAGQMFAYDAAGMLRQLSAYAVQLWQSFMVVGIGPGLLGAALLWRRDRALGGFLLLLFAANVIFYAGYRVVDKDTMYLPTYVVWVVWLALGLQALWRWLRQDKVLLGATRVLVAVSVLLAVGWNWHRVDLSDDWTARQQGEEILEVAEENAIVLGWWDTVPVVQYLQLVEGRRPDILAINRFLITDQDLVELIRNEAGRRPVYVNAPPPQLLSSMRVEAAGPLYHLYPKTLNQE